MQFASNQMQMHTSPPAFAFTSVGARRMGAARARLLATEQACACAHVRSLMYRTRVHAVWHLTCPGRQHGSRPTWTPACYRRRSLRMKWRQCHTGSGAPRECTQEEQACKHLTVPGWAAS